MDEWISQRLPRVTPAELEARTRVYSRELAAAGITTFTDATVRNGPEDVATFALLSAKGAIGQRIGVMIGQNQVDAINISRQAAEAAGFRLSGVKFMDLARWEPAPLARRVGRALSTGLDVAFHVTEVEELEAAITAIKASRREVNPRTLESTVCRIEHGGLIPDDYLQRLAALGVWVVTNPGFIHYRGPKYTTDPGLVPYLYRARSLLDASVQIAGATDAPVTPAKPFNAIAAAMNRLSMDGEELAPAESISFNEAFDLFTRSAARLSRLGAGEIATGYLADLIVVAADPANLTAAEIQTLAVDLTIVNGRVIYERGRPAVAQSDIANLYSP
jgi:predicted amidohydrolase YtcJ